MPGSGESNSAEEARIAFLDTPLSKIAGLHGRIYKAIRNELGDDCLMRQIVPKTQAQMLRLPNFGRKSLNEMIELFALHGLHFGMQISQLVETEPKSSHKLEIVGGLDQAQLKNWVVDLAAGCLQPLQFSVGKGVIDLSLITRTRNDTQRLIAQSVRDGKPLNLTFAEVEMVLTFDPTTQKGSIKFVS